MSEQTVKVKYSSQDEVYAEWFECTECGCCDIMKDFVYCPICGKKINWTGRKIGNRTEEEYKEEDDPNS